MLCFSCKKLFCKSVTKKKGRPIKCLQEDAPSLYERSSSGLDLAYLLLLCELGWVSHLCKGPKSSSTVSTTEIPTSSLFINKFPPFYSKFQSKSSILRNALTLPGIVFFYNALLYHMLVSTSTSFPHNFCRFDFRKQLILATMNRQRLANKYDEQKTY